VDSLCAVLSSSGIHFPWIWNWDHILSFTLFYIGSGLHKPYVSSRFHVFNTPISTTAPIDAKTHVWPIDDIAQWLTNQRSLLGNIQAKTWDVTGYQEDRVNKYKRIIGMHINLVRVIHSIQNSCITYSTQNQHFAEMFTCSDNTIVIIWIAIILLFQFICDFIYSAIIHNMCLMSVMTSMELSRAEYSADHSALFRRNCQNLRYPSSGWYA
jgi:hypothetical protein